MNYKYQVNENHPQQIVRLTNSYSFYLISLLCVATLGRNYPNIATGTLTFLYFRVFSEKSRLKDYIQILMCTPILFFVRPYGIRTAVCVLLSCVSADSISFFKKQISKKNDGFLNMFSMSMIAEIIWSILLFNRKKSVFPIISKVSIALCTVLTLYKIYQFIKNKKIFLNQKQYTQTQEHIKEVVIG